MIAINELSDLRTSSAQILEPLVIMLSPFAPHIAEELWEAMGHDSSVMNARFPEYVEKYTVEDSFDYPVSFNGKMRFKITLPKSLSVKEVEEAVKADPNTARYVGSATIKKIIVVPSKIINVVI